MTRKMIDCLNEVKAYPAVDVDKDLCYQKNYQVNSWFYVARGNCEENEIVFLYHASTYKFPGQAGILISNLTFNNQTTGERHVESVVYPLEQVEFGEDRLYIKCPNAEVSGDINAMYVKADTSIGSIDVKIVPVEYPLYNSRTGRYIMLDLDIHQYAFPNMETTGKINIKGKDYDFNGNSWLDRQWQIDLSMIDPENPPEMDLTIFPTWGWFAMTLETGENLSIWFPKDKGKWHAWATVLYPDGMHTLVHVDNVFETADNWFHHEDSPYTYATKYTVRIPEYDAELVVTSGPIDQEIRNDVAAAFNIYEGTCSVTGTWKGKPIKGVAFLEMIGTWIKELL